MLKLKAQMLKQQDKTKKHLSFIFLAAALSFAI